jgi:mRNA interferase MazF
MKRGDIWEVNLDPTIGAEIRKVRPCVIVSRDAMASLPLRIIVPLTQWNERFARAPWHVLVTPTTENGLAIASSADTFQPRSISTARLLRRVGHVSPEVLADIESGLALSLDLHPE